MDIDKTTANVWYLQVSTNDGTCDFTLDVDPKICTIMGAILHSHAYICPRRASMALVLPESIIEAINKTAVVIVFT